ncbi:retrovirus-related Pol polyprotein from transposon 17.6 [Trichonephila clavipes]|nr:retrovirus-related Pol polyprotein from transposon 17.6 [Trichonephila clavipes]
MSAHDHKSRYFQLTVNPSDIVKTAFVTNNGTYAFRRMLFGLSGASPNFQKEGIKTDETKVRAIVEMKPPRHSKEVSKFLASARVIADNFFDNYISRFGAPVKLISDNGLQFISDIFEHLSERLGIRHVKTVVYRPQANRTERVNRDLVQMIANYINDQHDTWDQFLREFAYAIRTAVNETTGKIHAELFLGRKLITPFQNLDMISDGTEFVVGYIERLFEEARQNTETKQEKW